jgi:hypothetical protein
MSNHTERSLQAVMTVISADFAKSLVDYLDAIGNSVLFVPSDVSETAVQVLRLIVNPWSKDGGATPVNIEQSNQLTLLCFTPQYGRGQRIVVDHYDTLGTYRGELGLLRGRIRFLSGPVTILWTRPSGATHYLGIDISNFGIDTQGVL